MNEHFANARKAVAGVLSIAILGTVALSSGRAVSINAVGAPSDDVYVNFAEALQLSTYFFDENRCGESSGRVEWRGDCHLEDAKTPLQPLDEETNYGTDLSAEWIAKYGKYLDPDGTGYVDLMGGWHDAGDHVKFGLPGAYAAATVGWSYYEFPDSFEEIGEKEHIEEILRWINDYYMKVTYLDENGDLVAYCYQVGDGDIDHNYWIPPELQSTELLDFARPAHFAHCDKPAVDQCCNAAASLAIHYLNFKDADPEYAQEALDKAKALYKFAREYYEPGTDLGGPTGFDGGFYTSSKCYDEYSWAAVWLYICTENQEYIDHIVSVGDDVDPENGSREYTGYLRGIIQDTGNCWNNIWVHCWDTVWGGVFAKLAPITNNARDWYIFRWNLEFWSGLEHQYSGDVTQLWNQDYVPTTETEQGAYINMSKEGFSVVNEYGSARYNCAAQMCAVVYAKYGVDEDPERFARWAKGQMIYIMGDNPMDYSYIVGYSDKSAKNPHHRAAHCSTTNSPENPAQCTHMLWGALVGGPDSNDYHHDSANDYVYNEVAVDYNCGLVGACAGLYHYFGKDDDVDSSEPRKDFPPKETDLNEFYVKGLIEQDNADCTQIKAAIYADTCTPPRFVDNIKIRYFFNISELYYSGQDIDDVKVAVFYDENDATYDGPAKVSEPVKWDDGGTYYVEIDWAGREIYGKREIMFGFNAVPDASNRTHWDASNDYSMETIVEDMFLPAENIAMYVGDELVYGIPPEKLTEVPADPTKVPEISVQARHNFLDGESNDVAALVKLENDGTGPLDLSTTKVRYWFSSDEAADLQAIFDYVSMGEDCVTGKLVKLEIGAETADYYYEIGFTEKAGVLGANSSSGDIQFRVIDGAYGVLSQANDYSYNGESEFAVNPKITVYSNGKLIYGTPPVQETEEPTVMWGDVVIDGKINLKDLVLLCKAVARIETLDDQQQLNADCLTDGKINLKDLVILSQHVAKFDVTFGPRE